MWETVTGVGKDLWARAWEVPLTHTEYSADGRERIFSPYPLPISPSPHLPLSLLSIILRNLQPSEIELRIQKANTILASVEEATIMAPFPNLQVLNSSYPYGGGATRLREITGGRAFNNLGFIINT